MASQVSWRDLRRGLTLIELLVSLTIVGILASLALPAVLAARAAAQRLGCQSNLRQLGLALLSYHDFHATFPFGWNSHGTGWSAMILPQIEQINLYHTLHFEERTGGNWDSGSPNTQACAMRLELFRCPSLSQPQQLDYNGMPGRVPASYRGCASSVALTDSPNRVQGGLTLREPRQNGIFFGHSRIAFADVRDGTSSTILLGESSTDPLFLQDGQAMDYWYFGSPQIDPWNEEGLAGTEFSEFVGSTAAPLNARFRPRINGHVKEISFGSYHRGGAQFCFADGSVRWLNEAVNRLVYRALGSRAGHEVVTGRY